MMTKEQQRIALAEWVGWKWIKSSNANTWAWFDPKWERQTCWCEHEPAKDSYLRFKPDEDLNAIHEAEMKLPDNNSLHGRVAYNNMLMRICGSHAACVSAPAAQRSETLSRTLFPERWEK